MIDEQQIYKDTVEIVKALVSSGHSSVFNLIRDDDSERGISGLIKEIYNALMEIRE